MRILYLTDADLAPFKAPQMHVYQFMASWHRAGEEVFLYAPGFDPLPPKPPFPHRWVPHSGIRKLGDLGYYLRLMRWLKRQLRQERWDIVYCREISMLPWLPELCAAYSVPCVTEINGFLPDNYRAGGAPAWKVRLVEYFQQRLMRASSALVMPYEELAARYVAHYRLPETKVWVIPNGVDEHRFVPEDRKACRQRLGLEAETLYIGYVGSFDYYHDFQTLLDALPAIIAGCERPVKCLLLGDGEKRPTLEKQAAALGLAQYLHFVGSVPNTEVAGYINAADVMLSLQPRARMEQFGEAGSLKLKEYLACEAQTIISHIPGHPSPFEGMCQLVPPEDAEALATAVLAMVSGKVHFTGLRDKMIPRYSWNASGLELLQRLKQLAGQG